MADNPRIEELKRRVQSDPASIAFAALAEEYRRAGQFDEAINTCKAGLQRHPAYLSAHVTLGRALIEVNRFDEAREELEYVLKVAPENLAAIRALAEIHDRSAAGTQEQHHKAEPDTAARAARVPEPAKVAAVAPVAAAAPVRVKPSVAPVSAPDPALAELEAFLDAIVRARQALDGTASDVR